MSVKTRVPAIRLTPRSTANTVLSILRLRATSSLSVSANIVQPPIVRIWFEDGVGGRVVDVGDDPTVGEEHRPVGIGRGDRVVGDHHDRLAELADGDPHERQHLAAAVRVEVAGRLVGEDDLRARADERTSDGDALLLTAGQLGRAMAEAVLEPDGVDDVVEPVTVDLAPGERGREHDVLLRGQRGHQVERLEDEADPVAPQLGEPAVVERRDVGVADVHRARRERVEPGDAMQQRRLAGARRSHDRREATGRELDGDAGEGVHGVVARCRRS